MISYMLAAEGRIYRLISRKNNPDKVDWRGYAEENVTEVVVRLM